MTDQASNIHVIHGLHNKARIFHHRAHAGELLSEMLQEYQDTDALVLAMPA